MEFETIPFKQFMRTYDLRGFNARGHIKTILMSLKEYLSIKLKRKRSNFKTKII